MTQPANKSDAGASVQPDGSAPSIMGHMYRGSDGAMTCAQCHSKMEWEECSMCGGDGGFDGYEEDPLWYHPGEMAPCPQCWRSSGGEWWCPNKQCTTANGWKVVPAPNDDPVSEDADERRNT